MAKESRCIKILKNEGEMTRRKLIEEGLLDNSLKPFSDECHLYIPVTGDIPGAATEIFEERDISAPLPRHELIGGIAIIQDCDRDGARRLLDSRPVIHTVLYSEGPVTGEYRTKDYIVLAGKNTTKTDYTEYGQRFLIDLSAAYFSARLANERQRIAAMMKDGERLLDMFAGVGPFAITLSGKCSVVYANDINPAAVSLLYDNIRLNKKKNILPVLADARCLGGIFPPGSFDRIIMNLPMKSSEFIDIAFRLCRPGGMIHFYTLQSEPGEMEEELGKYECGKISERVVRSYSPSQHHAVYDIRVI
ncbi:class I SAM-dependent methyltransferase [Methanolacinia paynteri]|uniref:class I SAM-dependent methyltransferase n=1 Tax=Methanolacinia paynteri TaxID=230356 RepID=UPI00064F2B10|nr:class I SAM-dependent methyltransferase family protein [Methanolacinia paynteri]